MTRRAKGIGNAAWPSGLKPAGLVCLLVLLALLTTVQFPHNQAIGRRNEASGRLCRTAEPPGARLLAGAAALETASPQDAERPDIVRVALRFHPTDSGLR